jgi:hypothetical protein
MRGLVGTVLGAVVLAVAAGGAAGAGRAGDPWVSFTDASLGIRVSIPRSWHTVPPTVAGVRAEAARLKGQQDGLAQVYASFVATPAARAQLLHYLFQAFQYMPAAAQQPDFAIAYARATQAVVSDLPALSASLAQSYGSQAETTVLSHGVVHLPAGRAVHVAATQVVGGDREQVEIYVLAHGTLLYTLAFRADAGAKAAGASFTAMARRFTFT